MVVPRGDATSIWVSNILYVMGGSDGNNNVLNSVEAFDPIRGVWSNKTGMPTSREGLVSGAVNGNIFAIGGRNPYNLAIVEQYNPSIDTWISQPSMFTSRSGCACVTYAGRIIVFGGESFATIGTTEEFNPATQQWKCRSPMPTGRLGMSASVVGKLVYLIGGGTNSGTITSSKNEVYYPASSQDPGACAPKMQNASSSNTPSLILVVTMLYLFGKL